ncbi:hypothetical protein ACFWN2_07415 [Lentzea sp. NPDC058436]|uniref:MoaF-related domain-containing protein n=1 Tax=Lentzea sp. NPDC058436 TaxID=3346499 RepID=UPI00366A2794
MLVFGEKYLADLGEMVIELHYESASRITVTVVDGEGDVDSGRCETVAVAMSEVRPGLYFTTWQESSGTHVTHLEDFANGVLRAVRRRPDGSAAVLTGTLRRGGVTM